MHAKQAHSNTGAHYELCITYTHAHTPTRVLVLNHTLRTYTHTDAGAHHELSVMYTHTDAGARF